MCIFSFWSVLEQLVNCFLNASARNIMNCSKTEVFFTPIFSYFSSTDKWSQLALMMEGVLQQLVVSFMSYHSLMLHDITYISLWAGPPPIASRKRLTSCSNTPSREFLPSYEYLISFVWPTELYFWDTNFIFWDNSWYSLKMPSGSSWQAAAAYSRTKI